MVMGELKKPPTINVISPTFNNDAIKAPVGGNKPFDCFYSVIFVKYR